MGHASLAPHYLLEPDRWLLIFSPTAASRFASLIALGHWKHVCAIGHIPELATWILYDPQLSGTILALAPGSSGLRQLLGYVAPGERAVGLMWMRRRPRRRFFPPAFFCTTAIAHMLGLPAAWRPDALWRVCLEHGGEPVRCDMTPAGDTAAHGQTSSTATAAAGPHVPSYAGAGATSPNGRGAGASPG
jgi:hypothetical protein